MFILTPFPQFRTRASSMSFFAARPAAPHCIRTEGWRAQVDRIGKWLQIDQINKIGRTQTAKVRCIFLCIPIEQRLFATRGRLPTHNTLIMYYMAGACHIRAPLRIGFGAGWRGGGWGGGGGMLQQQTQCINSPTRHACTPSPRKEAGK